MSSVLDMQQMHFGVKKVKDSVEFSVVSTFLNKILGYVNVSASKEGFPFTEQEAPYRQRRCHLQHITLCLAYRGHQISVLTK